MVKKRMIDLHQLNPDLDDCEQRYKYVFVYTIPSETFEISWKMETYDMEDIWTLTDIDLPPCYSDSDTKYDCFVNIGYPFTIDNQVKMLQKKLGEDFSPSNFFIYSYEPLECFEDMRRDECLFNMFDGKKYRVDRCTAPGPNVLRNNPNYWKKESMDDDDNEDMIENDDLFINMFTNKQVKSELQFVYNYTTCYVDELFRELQPLSWILKKVNGDFGQEYSMTKFKGTLRDAIDQTVDIVGNDKWHSIGKYTYSRYCSSYIPKNLFDVSVLVDITPLSDLLSEKSLQKHFIEKHNLFTI